MRQDIFSIPAARGKLDDALIFSEAGLTLAGRLLAAWPLEAFAEKPNSSLETDRVSVLLAIAFRKTLSLRQTHDLAEAARYDLRGDRALANIRLAIGGLSRVPDAETLVSRLDMAMHLLESGMPSRVLLEELGLTPRETNSKRYNLNQPRIPAGNGVESGRWGSGGSPGASIASGGAGSATASAPPEVLAPSIVPVSPISASSIVGAASLALPIGDTIGVEGTGLLARGLAGLSATALASLAVVAGAAAVFGELFVPTPNEVSSTGPLPGDLGTHYDYNHDEGVMRLIDTTGPQPMVIATGHRQSDGLFSDVATGIPFAREVDGALVFDVSAMAVAVGTRDKAETRGHLLIEAAAATAAKQGTLCADPGLDVPHGASERAALYQFQISKLNNPHRPLSDGLGVSLPDPQTGRRVVFDDCRDADGAMLEAKGPGFAKLLRSKYLRDVIKDRWANQAIRQTRAAGGRAVEWYFAEPESKIFADTLFDLGDDDKINRIITKPIITHYLPAVFP